MITIISGTNRTGSRTRSVALEIQRIYDALGVKHQLLDLAELPVELFSGTAYEEKPASFQKFSGAVLESDGLVIVTPEYNGGFPGVLKYFIDMLKFPESFEQRPVCFVGLAAGAWGGLRPVEQLQQIFAYRNALLYPARVFIPSVVLELDERGRFTGDEIRGRLQRQAEGFLSFTKCLEPHRSRDN